MSVQEVEACRGWYAGIEFSGLVRMAVQAGPPRPTRAFSVRTVLGWARATPRTLPTAPDWPPARPSKRRLSSSAAMSGQVDDGANRLRRWVQRHLRPPCKANLPLLVNNSWGDVMAVDEALMRRMIDSCARLGMELVGVDAGWYRHVGDWRTDPKKFPSGLPPVADYAHRQGLLFGLWLAWTQGGDKYDAARPGKILSLRDPAHAGLVPGRLPAELEEFGLHRGDRLPGRAAGGRVVSWRHAPRGSRSSRSTCWNTTR